MVIKHFLNRTGELARSLAHFGRLGKIASQRSFLNKEKRKFLIKIGEKSTELVKSQKINDSELSRLVKNLEKIEALLEKRNYGEIKGNNFAKKE